jgi:glutathione S-transferase
MLESYAANGTGTVRGGVKDHDKEIQIEFWQRAAKEGLTDERARTSAHKFRVAFDALDQRLGQHPYLMGDSLSVLDIAWLICAHRLSLAATRSRGCTRASPCGWKSFAPDLSLPRRSQCRRKR